MVNMSADSNMTFDVLHVIPTYKDRGSCYLFIDLLSTTQPAQAISSCSII